MFGTITVVGGSLAGLTVVQTLRDEGFEGRVVVIDPDPQEPYDRPPLSKQVLAGTWDVDKIALPPAKSDLGIEWVRGHAASSLDLPDRVVRLADGQTVGFDGLVIATGAVPRVLPAMGELRGIHVLRTLDDCLAIRDALDSGVRRVVVVGAGFIGAEVAATCRARDVEVVLLEALPVPLERALGAEVGGVVATMHTEHGADCRLGIGVEGFDSDDEHHVRGVRLSDGTTIAADLVVVGIGVAPATSWLEGSGIEVDNGVVVDGALQAAPGVVAVGDVARWPSKRYGRRLRVEHWENAIQMGEHAARTLLRESAGADEPHEVYDPIPWFWSDQYDVKIQLAGHSSGDDRFEVVHGSVEERRFVGLYGREDRLVGVLGFHRPRQVVQLRQLLVDGTSWDDAVATARAL